MTSAPFVQHIRAAISDASLQAALDANAERRVRGRITAFASLPDWADRRQRAHAMRAEVIAHLDEHLAAFTTRLSENGIRVHRAASAAEAIELVVGIAEGGGAKLFAKSKSMVSEEIELNRALTARGHRVVETDLGEYIVQLRGEKPAHIITPAVHLRRHQVGELFHERLGIPYTDDIPTLTAAARAVLREVFLAADVGISGVNFGVVETGTLCIVTNEGNGRMVTTMPPVHIALMGMERLVPSLNDLALMLSLLPRSATAQKLSVYTQLINSPRREGEVDGAPERHVIIVDNGRSGMRGGPLREALYCIRCGACLNACPVFREIGGHAYVGKDGSPAPYPGPIGSVVSPGLLGPQRFGDLAQASSLCGACKDACPVDIDLPMLLTRVRAGASDKTENGSGTGLSALSRFGLTAYAAIASSRRLFASAQWLAGWGARVISPTAEWMRAPAATGWGLSKDFPRPAVKPFRARWRHTVPPGPIAGSQLPDRPTAERVGTAGQNIGDKPQPEELVRRFMTELEEIGATTRRISSTNVTAELTELCRKANADVVTLWPDIKDVEAGVLEQAGLRVSRTADPAIKVGITACTCAIAETGTLVLVAAPGQPLTTSLLPEIHVAIVQSTQIVASMEEALRMPEVRESSAAVLISGPSRTADIEMTLTIGVHGPRELIVFVTD